jgi:hypothetical protein
MVILEGVKAVEKEATIWNWVMEGFIRGEA